MYTYWETSLNHAGGYTDKGRRFEKKQLQNVKQYGRMRLLWGECRGWYIEDEKGNVIEKHTMPGNIQ